MKASFRERERRRERLLLQKRFEVGTRVQVKSRHGLWFAGMVTSKLGLFGPHVIRYDDGSVEADVPWEDMRREVPPPAPRQTPMSTDGWTEWLHGASQPVAPLVPARPEEPDSPPPPEATTQRVEAPIVDVPAAGSDRVVVCNHPLSATRLLLFRGPEFVVAETSADDVSRVFRDGVRVTLGPHALADRWFHSLPAAFLSGVDAACPSPVEGCEGDLLIIKGDQWLRWSAASHFVQHGPAPLSSHPLFAGLPHEWHSGVDAMCRLPGSDSTTLVFKDDLVAAVRMSQDQVIGVDGPMRLSNSVLDAVPQTRVHGAAVLGAADLLVVARPQWAVARLHTPSSHAFSPRNRSTLMAGPSPFSEGFLSSIVFEADGAAAIRRARSKPEYLLRAAATGDIHTVAKILNEGQDVNVEANGHTALFAAAVHGQFEMVEYLVGTCQAATDHVSSADGDTVLCVSAVHRRNLPTVRFLLQHGADPTVVNVNGLHALYFACLHACSLEMVRLLVRSGAKPLVRRLGARGETCVTAAICALFIADKEPEEEREPEALGILDFLLRNGAESIIDHRLEGSRLTALHLAVDVAATGRQELGKAVASRLLTAADPHAADIGGSSPLRYAIDKGQIAMALMFLDHGQKVALQAQAEDIDHFLWWATEHREVDLADRLLNDFDANIDYQEPAKHRTMLHHAVMECDLELAELATEMFADVNLRDAHGLTPLELWAELQPDQKRVDAYPIAELLLTCGAVFTADLLAHLDRCRDFDADRLFKHKSSLLHLAVQTSSTSAVRWILEHYPHQLWHTDSYGLTPRDYAGGDEEHRLLAHKESLAYQEDLWPDSLYRVDYVLAVRAQSEARGGLAGWCGCLDDIMLARRNKGGRRRVPLPVQQKRQRLKVLERVLKQKGLCVIKVHEEGAAYDMLLISASKRRLLVEAGRMHLQLADDRGLWGRATARPRAQPATEKEWVAHVRDAAVGPVRELIVRHILDERGSLTSLAGDDLDLRKLVRDDTIDMHFPLHRGGPRTALWKLWKGQPFKMMRSLLTESRHHRYFTLTAFRNYFGEHLAMYLGFMCHFCIFVLILSAVGLGFSAIQVLEGPDNETVVIYALVVSVWSSAFVDRWKRKSSELQFNWGTLNYSLLQRPRPDFSGVRVTKPSLQWVDEHGNRNPNFWRHPITQEKEPYYPSSLRMLQYIRSGVMLALMLMFVVGCLGVVVYLREQHSSQEWKYAAGAIGAGLVVVLDSIYVRLATYFTFRENHRTDADFDASLMVKNFSFQLLNSFSSPLYIALVERSIANLNIEIIMRLSVQLGISVFKEYFFVYMLARQAPDVNAARAGESSGSGGGGGGGGGRGRRKHGHKLSRVAHDVDNQAHLPAVDSLFFDYNQISVIYALLVCFATACPVAPIIALLFLLLQVYGDVWKYLFVLQRFPPRRAGGIGVWLHVFVFLSYLAIPMNAMLAFYVSDKWRAYTGATGSDSAFTSALVFVIAVGLCKLFLETSTADKASWVRYSLAAKQFDRRKHRGGVVAAAAAAVVAAPPPSKPPVARPARRNSALLAASAAVPSPPRVGRGVSSKVVPG